jgi:hypothetical protein
VTVCRPQTKLPTRYLGPVSPIYRSFISSTKNIRFLVSCNSVSCEESSERNAGFRYEVRKPTFESKSRSVATRAAPARAAPLSLRRALSFQWCEVRFAGAAVYSALAKQIISDLIRLLKRFSEFRISDSRSWMLRGVRVFVTPSYWCSSTPLAPSAKVIGLVAIRRRSPPSCIICRPLTTQRYVRLSSYHSRNSSHHAMSWDSTLLWQQSIVRSHSNRSVIAAYKTKKSRSRPMSFVVSPTFTRYS